MRKFFLIVFNFVTLFFLILFSACTQTPNNPHPNKEYIPYDDSMTISYKDQTYSNFFSFLIAYYKPLVQFNFDDIVNGKKEYLPFNISEDVIYNGESLFHMHTQLTKVANPYKEDEMIPYYNRYQTNFPQYNENGYYLALFGALDKMIYFNSRNAYYYLYNYAFESQAEDINIIKATYAPNTNHHLYNPLFEDLYEHINNKSYYENTNPPVFSNFKIISQTSDSFTVTLDILAWRIAYVSNSVDINLLKDPNDFWSTISLQFSFDKNKKELIFSFDPTASYYIPFLSNQELKPNETFSIVYKLSYQELPFNYFTNYYYPTSSEITNLVRLDNEENHQGGELLKN